MRLEVRGTRLGKKQCAVFYYLFIRHSTYNLKVEDDYELRIYDYDLDDNYFVGVIVGEDGQRLRFSLRHVSSPNWNNYRWGYSDYYDPYYYSNENATGMQRAKAKDGSTTEVPDRPQRVFGRTKKD